IAGTQGQAAPAGTVAGFENRHVDVAVVREQLVRGGQPADAGTNDHNVFSVEAVPPDHVRIVGDLHLVVRGPVERRPGAGSPVMHEIFASAFVHLEDPQLGNTASL